MVFTKSIFLSNTFILFSKGEICMLDLLKKLAASAMLVACLGVISTTGAHAEVGTRVQVDNSRNVLQGNCLTYIQTGYSHSTSVAVLKSGDTKSGLIAGPGGAPIQYNSFSSGVETIATSSGSNLSITGQVQLLQESKVSAAENSAFRR
jgi:hypothetical protein